MLPARQADSHRYSVKNQDLQSAEFSVQSVNHNGEPKDREQDVATHQRRKGYEKQTSRGDLGSGKEQAYRVQNARVPGAVKAAVNCIESSRRLQQ